MINTDVTNIETQLITDGEIINLDDSDNLVYDTANISLSEEDIQIIFDRFVIENVAPFYPESRTVGRVKTSIYSFFKKHFPKIEPLSETVQKIVLSNGNKQLFVDALNDAKSKYIEGGKNAKRELEKHSDWEVPLTVNYSEKYHKISSYSLSIMEPFFEYMAASDVEKKFAKYLDNNKNKIEWWFKNGDRDRTFFAVPRKENNKKVPFYVDWIVQYTDGKIGLFETKGGITAETAGSRGEGLAIYVEEQKKLGKKLIGGIIVEKNGSFWLNSKKKYEFNEDDLPGSGWHILQ